MAVVDQEAAVKERRQKPARVSATERRGAPVWVLPATLIGLLLIFVGQRVLGAMELGSQALTGLGLVILLLATGFRFVARSQAPDAERRHIETVLAVLGVVIFVGVGLYFVSTEGGAKLFALDQGEPDTQERVGEILLILWTSLIAIGTVPMLFAEAALLPMRRAERPESRRVRAAVVSGLSVVLAGIYCSLFVYAAGGVDHRVDYSYFKTSEPSESTKKIAQSLTETVKVVAFYPDVNEIKVEVRRYLEGVARQAPKLEVEVVDRLLVPKRARELRANQDGVVILSRGTKTETLTIGTEAKNAKPKLKTLDRDFQERLLKLVRSSRTAYLTVGHGELNDPIDDKALGGSVSRKKGVLILKKLLQKQNYTVKNLGLADGLGSQIPEDAHIVFVLGPSEPFSQEELGTLKRYVDAGGKLFMALDPEALKKGQTSLDTTTDDGSVSGAIAPSAKPAASLEPPVLASARPPSEPAPAEDSGLSALAAVVGLKYDTNLLANERQHVRRRFNNSDRTLLVTNRFSSHAAVSTLSRNSSRAAVVLFGSGSLERLGGATQKIDFALRSVGNTFIDKNANYQADSGEQLSSYNMAAAISAPKKGGSKAKKPTEKASKDKLPDEMRAFVVADADCFSDLVLSNVIGNQVLLVDAARWLGGEESFAGKVNSEEDVRIEHTKQKDLIWFYATIFFAPALVLGAGLMYIRRSKKSSGGRR